MNLTGVRDNYHYLTGEASRLVRQLGFAGIAMIWVFRTEVAGQLAVPRALIPPGTLIVVALTLDLLHYVVGSAVWGIYGRWSAQPEAWDEEKRVFDRDRDLTIPRWINWPALAFFWAKIVVMIVAYILLFLFLYRRIQAP